MKYADLHIHTNCSDATLTPEDVVRQAYESELACIAITDHDTVSAIAPAIKAAEKFNIELIPGVELSAEIDNTEIHILGYFIDWQTQWFQNKLEQIRQIRKERALTIVYKLSQQGVELDPEQLLRQASSAAIGRPHIARMLQEAGFVGSVQEAFDKYIGNHGPCYVKKFKLTPDQAIAMIRRLSGIPVLAHPQFSNDSLILKFADSGLRGLEVYCSQQEQAISEHYRNLAKQYGLLITGGSDCHGLNKDKAMIGEVKIPYSLVEALKKEAEILQGK